MARQWPKRQPPEAQINNAVETAPKSTQTPSGLTVQPVGFGPQTLTPGHNQLPLPSMGLQGLQDLGESMLGPRCHRREQVLA